MLRVPFGAAKKLTASSHSRGARVRRWQPFITFHPSLYPPIMFLRLSFLLLIFPFFHFYFLFCFVCRVFDLNMFVLMYTFSSQQQAYSFLIIAMELLTQTARWCLCDCSSCEWIGCLSVSANPRVLPFQKSKRKKKIVGQIIKAGVEHERP
jgi:hypothetical protein